MAIINKNGTYMALPSAIKRGSAIALDTTSIWYDRALMEAYAAGGEIAKAAGVAITAYVGQVLTLVDETNKTATMYIIENAEGGLKEIGAAILDDEQVENIQGNITAAQEDITDINNLLNGTEDAPGLIEEVNDIADILYGTEGENPVPGLVDDVLAIEQNLTNNYYTKEETYNRSEIDGKVNGLFHFKGTLDSEEALPDSGNISGDVYQIGDSEFAWNGENWVKLGYTIDLSNYYIKSEVDGKVKEVNDALDTAKEDIAANADDIVELQAADVAINEEIDGIKGQHNLLATEVGTISNNYTTKFAAVDTEITNLKAKDTEQDSRLDNLTNYIGVPTDETLTLFPAVEGILTELENLKIEAGAGETNVIEGITINGETIQPNTAKIVALPTFSGSKAGLVPAITETVSENAVLASNGSWLDVGLLIDSKLDEVLTWDTI